MENDSVLMTPPASASSGGEEHPFHSNLSKASTERHSHSNRSPTKHAEMKFSCEELESKPYYSPGGENYQVGLPFEDLSRVVF